MITLGFMTVNRKMIRFDIHERRVWYYDDNWKEGIQIMPLEQPSVRLAVKKMITSRKPSVSAIGLLIADANLGKNKEEYDACANDVAIADMIRRDSKLKGLVEVL